MPNTSTSLSRAWKQIKQHRGWLILGSILAFLLWVFPLGVATVWPVLVRDKSLPEWLADNGWPSLTVLVIGWLTLAFLLTLVGLVIIVAISKRACKASHNAQEEVTGIDPLCSHKVAEVESEWAKLNENQRVLLKRIYVAGQLSWSQIDEKYKRMLPVYVDPFLIDYLLERSTLLECTNSTSLWQLKYGKKTILLPDPTWKVKPDLRIAVGEIVTRELDVSPPEPHVPPQKQVSEQPEAQTKIAPKPDFKVVAPTAFPGLIKLDVNVFRRTTSNKGSVFPVIVTFENLPQPNGFNETDTVWAHIVYRERDFGNMELVRVSSGCWVDEPLPDVAFPFRKPRYLILGGWHVEGKKPSKNEFRVFEQSRELHRAVESPIKMAAPRKIVVDVVLTPNGHHELSREYRFGLHLRSAGFYSVHQILTG